MGWFVECLSVCSDTRKKWGNKAEYRVILTLLSLCRKIGSINKKYINHSTKENRPFNPQRSISELLSMWKDCLLISPCWGLTWWFLHPQRWKVSCCRDGHDRLVLPLHGRTTHDAWRDRHRKKNDPGSQWKRITTHILIWFIYYSLIFTISRLNNV